MALIGSINEQGELQGQINGARYLTGVITNASAVGGQVVGMRGLQGEKGDTGDTGATGADGQDGADGFSPSASVSKVGDTTTITITDKDGTTTASVYDGKPPVIFDYDIDNPTTPSYTEIGNALRDGKRCYVRLYQSGDVYGSETYLPLVGYSDEYYVFFAVTSTVGFYRALTYNVSTMSPAVYTTGFLQQELVSGTNIKTINNTSILGSGNIDIQGGGASAFIAEYGVTTYADVKDAYDDDAIILCTVDDSGNTAILQLAYFDDANDTFYFAQPNVDGWLWASVAIDDTWDDGSFQFASTDTATDLRDGLMSALDWQKLDGIASGAEVNVQSDWNEADSTADDYIKNKPTIPSKTSDINNDSGFITGLFVASYGSSTYADVLAAFQAKKMVYCRASSNSNPATGNQLRMAFLAYVNNDTTPTEFEFQYYRSVSTHSDSQQGDQVFVYKLNSSGTWSVTVRESYTKVVAGTNMSSSYSSGKITLSADGTSVPTADKVSEFDSDAHMNSTDMTTGSGSELEDFIDGLNVGGGSAFLDMFYPVGSYYETSDSTFDPNVKWGGTWSLETAGQVHVSAGTGYAIGSTGGSETVTLTTNQIPSHGHSTKGEYVYYDAGSKPGTVLLWGTGTASVQNAGGGQAHNNMQPYIVVNRWHRTA